MQHNCENGDYGSHGSENPSVVERADSDDAGEKRYDSQTLMQYNDRHQCYGDTSQPTTGLPVDHRFTSTDSRTNCQMIKSLTDGHIDLASCLASQMSLHYSRTFPQNRPEKQREQSEPESANHGSGHSSNISHNNRVHQTKELINKTKAQEEQILQLKKRIADSAIKELKLINEKCVLEKRVADMRILFDQQQQDFIDTASKSISNRQDIIEENIRLTYALQEVEQERLIFISSLLPLLAEYDLQPNVTTAHSIVSSIRVLVQHLHQRVNLNEAKLRETEHQLLPWQSDARTLSSVLQPPSNSNEHLPERSIVRTNEQQPDRSIEKSAFTTPSYIFHSGSNQGVMHQRKQFNDSNSNMFQYSEPGISNNHDYTVDENLRLQFPRDTSLITEDKLQPVVQRNQFQTINNQILYGKSHNHELTDKRNHEEKEYPQQKLLDDPPILPSDDQDSSLSEEDDSLPAIENLQVVGDAFLGSVIQACGYQTNGTTLCNFEWVRHLQDGTVCYIEGANHPDYIVTADDVDTVLAVDCVPMDDSNRTGKLVKAFANNQNKITCDAQMQLDIDNHASRGNAEFNVLVPSVHSEVWEESLLILRRSSFEIHQQGHGQIVKAKYSADVSLQIHYGYSTQCLLIISEGKSYPLETEDVRLRDTLVLTMRLFQRKALERKKGKQKVSFLTRMVM